MLRKTRFFSSVPLRGDTDEFEPPELPTTAILDDLADLLREAHLVVPVPVGSRFFRARQHQPSESVATAATLGPPTEDQAIYSNRMSPHGIVMFYGAGDQQTAALEAFDRFRLQEGDTELTVGEFSVIRPFKVIELRRSMIPLPPSVFDRSARDRRIGVFFLMNFSQEIAEPAPKDGLQRTQYVPTQIVTEYFRHVFKDPEGDSVRGLLYQSARNPSGYCYVLFFDANACGREPREPFGSKVKWLQLDAASIRHLKCEEPSKRERAADK